MNSEAFARIRNLLNGSAPRPADAWAALGGTLRAAALKPFEVDLVARFIAENETAFVSLAHVPVVRIAILGSYTTSGVANAIRCGLAGEGFLARVYEAPFAAWRQEALDPGSALYREPRDLVLLALSERAFSPWPGSAASASEVETGLTRHAEAMETVWQTLHARLKCPVFQHTLECRGLSYIGPAERELAGAADAAIAGFNAMMRGRAPAHVYWVDTAALAAEIGWRNWVDPRLHYHGKFGFGAPHLDDYARLFLGVFRAVHGRTRKCLAVDLDNTLWGGVIGDAGLDGIELGPDSPAGEAYVDFCLYLKELAQRGVILAVCSKNEESIARQVFDRHPHMPLKRSDFAVFCCNWEDKAANLAQMARRLNIDPAHMVFADDNPAECERVRQALPSVTVVQLPEDPSGFVRAIDRLHLFDAVHLSAEDRLRAESYQARSKAESLRQEATDLPTYLRSLCMEAEFGPAAAADLPRLAQMEGKTNQFNLTTRRYSESDLAAMRQDPAKAIFSCRMRDRFAEHGLISSVILSKDGAEWSIDSWLMSCRVFSRTLEQFILNRLVAFAREQGAKRLMGRYVPTEKNVVVKDLYARLGFQRGDADGVWHLDLDGVRPLETFVAVRAS